MSVRLKYKLTKPLPYGMHVGASEKRAFRRPANREHGGFFKLGGVLFRSPCNQDHCIDREPVLGSPQFFETTTSQEIIAQEEPGHMENPSGPKNPQQGLWSIYHVGIVTGHGIWFIWSLRTEPYTDKTLSDLEQPIY